MLARYRNGNEQDDYRNERADASDDEVHWSKVLPSVATLRSAAVGMVQSTVRPSRGLPPLLPALRFLCVLVALANKNSDAQNSDVMSAL